MDSSTREGLEELPFPPTLKLAAVAGRGRDVLKVHTQKIIPACHQRKEKFFRLPGNSLVYVLLYLPHNVPVCIGRSLLYIKMKFLLIGTHVCSAPISQPSVDSAGHARIQSPSPPRAQPTGKLRRKSPSTTYSLLLFIRRERGGLYFSPLRNPKVNHLSSCVSHHSFFF